MDMTDLASPTDILMQEHRLIEHVLDALETAADQMERRQAVRPGFFLDAADFIAGFADGCHHRKEEGVLFGALRDSGMPVAGGPIELMLDEHEQGRRLARGMRDAARRLEGSDAARQPEGSDDDADRRSLITNARGYVALLREHIIKEDEMLFPMADELLSAERQDQVRQGFEQVERDDMGAGAAEKFQTLADKLGREANALRPT